MKIIYIQDDIMNCAENYILHGCNAQRVFGAGVALAIKKKYKHAYTAYMKGSHDLGTVTYSKDIDGKIVFNCITQEFYGREIGKQYVSYEAIRKCIKRVDIMFSEGFLGRHVAMPLIGAGLGGGDWEVIKRIIEDNSNNFQPVVYYL